jgi:hypothetical protein
VFHCASVLLRESRFPTSWIPSRATSVRLRRGLLFALSARRLIGDHLCSLPLISIEPFIVRSQRRRHADPALASSQSKPDKEANNSDQEDKHKEYREHGFCPNHILPTPIRLLHNSPCMRNLRASAAAGPAFAGSVTGEIVRFMQSWLQSSVRSLRDISSADSRSPPGTLSPTSTQTTCQEALDPLSIAQERKGQAT